MPYKKPNEYQSAVLQELGKVCAGIQKNIRKFRIEEVNYSHSPITPASSPESELTRYYNYENALLTQILLN